MGSQNPIESRGLCQQCTTMQRFASSPVLPVSQVGGVQLPGVALGWASGSGSALVAMPCVASLSGGRASLGVSVSEN